MEKLESLYTRGDFEAARKLLIERQDKFPEGLFHYNLGTLYAREGNLALGRYHLEKALAKNFANKMLFNNLGTVKEELNVLELGRSENLSERVIDGSLSFPPGFWLSLTLSLLLTLIVLVKKRMLRGIVLLGISLLLALLPFSYSQLYLHRMRYAVVLQDTEIHEGPSHIYSSTGIVRGGSKIVVGKSNNNRYFIAYPRILSGWIHRDYLGFLQEIDKYNQKGKDSGS